MSCSSCQKTISTIARGATGLTKAALNLDLADPTAIATRRDICRACEHATRNPERVNLPSKGLTTFSRCEKCTCFIVAKTKLVQEKCPEGKW